MKTMENIYIPQLAKIKKIVDETPDVKSFYLSFVDEKFSRSWSHKPGQFVEVSVFGKGEFPIGISSSPTEKDFVRITVRAVGRGTRALHQKTEGDIIGIRGPLGNGFPYNEIKGKDILFVGGGIGLPPLRSLIDNVLDKEERKFFGRVIILYGARTPQDMVYKDILEEWRKRDDIEYLDTVDVSTNGWSGNVGVVTTLFPKIKIEPKKTVAFTCGPPIMIKFVIQDLLKMGFDEDNIISTLERYMKCGVGKCGHCAIGHKYICTDGPVFTYKQIKNLPEKP